MRPAAPCALAVTLLGASAAQARDRSCTLESHAHDPFFVDVTPRGTAPIRVRVSDLPVSVQLPELEAVAHVEVHGALVFQGTVEPGRLPLRIKHAVDATNGMVRLAAATEGLTVRGHGRLVEADVVLGSVRLRGLYLPCEALTLDPVPRPELGPTDENRDLWMAATSTLHFRSEPGAGTQLAVELQGDLAALDLHPSEHRGGWIRVSSHWLDGTTLVGWVAQKELRRPPARGGEIDEMALPDTAGPRCSRTLAERPGEHIAPAMVAAGTTVYATRYLGAWATVPKAQTLTVRYRGHDDWVELVEVPGLAGAADCPEHSTVLDDAWIPRQAIQLLPPSTDGGTH
jgi:hypothetical protein